MTRRIPLMDRRALFASGAVAALLTASGVSAAGAPRTGGRFRMALSGAGRDDNWTSGDSLFMQVARQGMVFDTLTEVAADGTLQGELATHWHTSDGGREWIFNLRQLVPFHDGSEFEAKDVVATLTPLFGETARVVADGKYTVQIILDTPNAGLPLLLSQPQFVIHPAHASHAGIGTGLYQVKHFSAGQQLLTQRVGAHYKDGNAGWFDEVELMSIPSEKVRVQALGEYLVDAVDIVGVNGLVGLPDIVALPHVGKALQAVSRDLVQPVTVGNLSPLDNLRAAERWWFDRN